MKKFAVVAIAAGLMLASTGVQAGCHTKTCTTYCYQPCATYCYQPVCAQPCYRTCCRPAFSWLWCW